MKTREERIKELHRVIRDRILVLDGAMGTMLQKYELEEKDFRGERFADHGSDLKGNHDILCVTQPEIVKAVHMAYLEAGSDILETNTFSGTSIAQADYGLEAAVYDINRDGAMQGPNVEATADLARAVSIPVIASGGVSSMDDLIALRDCGANLNGAISGRALYDGALDLKAALAALKS